jgi:hypothetical protein
MQAGHEESALAAEMESCMTRTFQDSQSARPAATMAQYGPKVEEFKRWCKKKKFPSSTLYAVTEAKLHFFLVEEVIGRKRKNGKNAGKDIVGHQTVLSYVSAITDLYTQQKMANVNSNSTPRGPSVKALLKTTALKKEEVRKINHEDRGKGTLLDVIASTSDLKRISAYYFKKDGRCDIRNLAMFLLCHFGLMRGQDARSLELADLFCLIQPTEYEQDCLTLVAVLCQGKTNPFGKKLMAGFIRNKMYEICPIGSLGFYFFYR